ncbi:MAG: hypothetical protein AB8B77_02130 [Alphaproteobacteria bacterium]
MTLKSRIIDALKERMRAGNLAMLKDAQIAFEILRFVPACEQEKLLERCGDFKGVVRLNMDQNAIAEDDLSNFLINMIANPIMMVADLQMPIHHFTENARLIPLDLQEKEQNMIILRFSLSGSFYKRIDAPPIMEIPNQIEQVSRWHNH